MDKTNCAVGDLQPVRPLRLPGANNHAVQAGDARRLGSCANLGSTTAARAFTAVEADSSATASYQQDAEEAMPDRPGCGERATPRLFGRLKASIREVVCCTSRASTSVARSACAELPANHEWLHSRSKQSPGWKRAAQNCWRS
uniref:(northern house mosquito) hypothetical protein n=1 Tax=Culex pipiens TaxID=7175 RepID=A0A8D8CKP4_CULPI